MENIEIILIDFSKEKIDKLIYEELKLPVLKEKSSYFYDNSLAMDLNFSQVKSIKEVLSPKGTGNIFLEELKIGISLKDILVIMSFDENYGDVVFSFPENEVLTDEKSESKFRLKSLIDFLINLKEDYDIPKVIIGYEPATDEDTLLIEIRDEEVDYEKEIEKILS